MTPMSTPTYDCQQIEPRIRKALYDGLGQHIAVGTEEADNGRVFLKVISPNFNDLSASERQDRIWAVLKALGPEAQAISLALAFGTDEI
jgi:hypothetical protein